MHTMRALHTYGNIKQAHAYRVLDQGRDWYLVLARGKAVYVFDWVFEPHHERDGKQKEKKRRKLPMRN